MLKAKSLMPMAALAGAALLASACTSTGNVERNAAGGAALGALAGAVIGNNVGSGDAGTGAAIGAALGGAAGVVRGCRQDGGCGAEGNQRRQYYDERAGEKRPTDNVQRPPASPWDRTTLVDLFASYPINDTFSLDFNMSNVFDRYYVEPLNLAPIPGPGRTASLTLTGKF